LTNAQNTNSNHAKEVKAKKIIVAYQDYPEDADDEKKALVDSTNKALEFAMKNFWDFNEIHDFMTLDDAKAYIEANDGFCYITIDIGESKSTTRNNTPGSIGPTYKWVSYAEKLSVYTPKPISNAWLPRYEGPMSNATAAFAVQQMNILFTNLYEEKFSSLMKSRGYVKSIGHKVAEKTLYIPKAYLNPKLTRAEILKAYPYDLEFVELSEVEDAILEKNTEVAVAYYIIAAMGGKHFHRVYISDAATGEVYGALDGPALSLELGLFGDVGGNSGKKFLINKKELEQLNNIVK
tara:strand:+ start:9618 stop:10496 length:879 start_codon:yes stop_codon:yes gene_type:complete